jgi:pimeloyl-ACP methyl ester carboxylesterase
MPSMTTADEQASDIDLPDRGRPMIRFPALFAVVLATGSAAVFAADDSLPQTVNLRSADGHPLALTYYPVATKANSGAKENTPVIVLLHGSDQVGRVRWDKEKPRGGQGKNFVESLQEDGFAVVTVDLRKFGDSKSPTDGTSIRLDDWEKMGAGDMFAVKQFLFEKHQEKQLNMNKLGIVAAGPTAVVAINFAAADWTTPPYDDAPVLANKTPRGQDVRALVLLSPETSAGRMNINRAMTVLRATPGIAMLIVEGKQDPQDKGQSRKIFEQMDKAQGKGEKRAYMVSPASKDRELNLMGKFPDQVEVPIRNFFIKYVKDANSPWRDRRNKVTG